MLLAGVYDLRSDDEDGLSPADIRCVVVLIPLLEGRLEVEGRAELEGLSPLETLEGLDDEEDAGLTPADDGLLTLPATCNPP